MSLSLHTRKNKESYLRQRESGSNETPNEDVEASQQLNQHLRVAQQEERLEYRDILHHHVSVVEPHLSELAAVPLFDRHLGAGPDDDAVDVAGHERREAGHRSERHGLLGEEDEVDRLRRPDPGPSLRAWTGVFLPLDPEDQDSSPGTQVLPVVVDDAGPDAYC